MGIKKSKITLANYLRCLETAFFIFAIEKFIKTKEKFFNQGKFIQLIHYFVEVASSKINELDRY